MSVEVYLYNFSKKENSTAQPTGTAAATLSGEVAHDFSPLAPIITFNLADPTVVPSYNYAEVPDFGNRYYFITNWVYVSGLWRCTMAVDVLATYKDTIVASSQYIARSKTYNPGDVIDGSYETTTLCTASRQNITQTEFWGTDYDEGTIVCGIINNSGYNIGAVTYYAFDVNGFRRLMAQMLASIDWMNISVSEISTDLQKALINPTQYIVSCVWLPLNGIDFVVRYDDGGNLRWDVTSTVRLGWWDFTLTGGTVARIMYDPFVNADSYVVKSGYFSLASHGQSGTFGKWLNLSPYTQRTLYFMPFGVFNLDSYSLARVDTIYFEVRMHAFNGDATLRIYADDPGSNPEARLLEQVNANVGVQIPIGQIAVDMNNWESALTAGALAGVGEIANMWTENSAASTGGHYGGTTISGSHGGSHYSGKF